MLGFQLLFLSTFFHILFYLYLYTCFTFILSFGFIYCVPTAPVFAPCLVYFIDFISVKPNLVAYSSKGAAEIMSIFTMMRGQDTNEKPHKRYPDTLHGLSSREARNTH
jgi:hypothetical protein